MVFLKWFLPLIDLTYCKIWDFKVERKISNSEEHDLLEERPKKVKLNIAPEHNADLNLTLLRLEYYFLLEKLIF